MSANLKTVAAINGFLDACPHNKWMYPFGYEMPIPMSSEQLLLAAVQEAGGIDIETLDHVRPSLTMFGCYGCVMFAVRMAIDAVNTGCPENLTYGLYGMIIDNGRVDWRDRHRALSVIEHCASRVSVNLSQEFGRLEKLISDEAKRTTDIYFCGEPSQRAVEAMGFHAIEDSDGIRFLERI